MASIPHQSQILLLHMDAVLVMKLTDKLHDTVPNEAQGIIIDTEKKLIPLWRI